MNVDSDDLRCPECNSELEECEIENIPSLACNECHVDYVPKQAVDEAAAQEDDESEVCEAQIDPDNPECPVCKSDDLKGEVIESEDDGEEECWITCENCKNEFLVSPEDDSEED